jgi:NAD-dependent dihydropyrimidine dehydrogenase PreA subunit
MGEFIKIEIDGKTCLGISKCGECVVVCPVNVFEAAGGLPSILETNEDECTLCELCLKACSPGAITIHKLYE